LHRHEIERTIMPSLPAQHAGAPAATGFLRGCSAAPLLGPLRPASTKREHFAKDAAAGWRSMYNKTDDFPDLGLGVGERWFALDCDDQIERTGGGPFRPNWGEWSDQFEAH